MTNRAEMVLWEIVNKLINSGATRIVLPGSLVNEVSEETLVEIRQLCKLTGIKEIMIDATT
jgi:hypothetical protein